MFGHTFVGEALGVQFEWDARKAAENQRKNGAGYWRQGRARYGEAEEEG